MRKERKKEDSAKDIQVKGNNQKQRYRQPKEKKISADGKGTNGTEGKKKQRG
jgi:hypothetical protein